MSTEKKGGFMPFLWGIAAALIVGWIIFPRILYTAEEQPLSFNHELHQKYIGECELCHSNEKEGVYAERLASTEDCALCHYTTLGDTPEEEKLVREYVRKDRQIPWVVYQEQPDNVYFSHLPHEEFECSRCHGDMESSEQLPVRRTNRLTGYTRTTMKMDECERCHAEEDASNACFVCHK